MSTCECGGDKVSISAAKRIIGMSGHCLQQNTSYALQEELVLVVMARALSTA